MARRLPVGSVKIPDKKQPSGTHSKLIEPWNRQNRMQLKILIRCCVFYSKGKFEINHRCMNV